MWIVFDSAIKVSTLVSTLKEEGRRKKEEGRRENYLWIVFDSAIKVSYFSLNFEGRRKKGKLHEDVFYTPLHVL
ncbi:MAG: hypothetical protein F6K48_21930 [Okeania sp. SIO3H1]|uniref:hypothetical protein n=1 Tax=Okeania sp. SIO1I7 TaxID=2607772 RepID=UPI0013C75354|nr:hypothetical protein [Okeania sp. SIO1I7]NEN91417.1 hypothetical protein [Okeania sp. SIO3H1]NET25308.1 hypothetical protein [Okeania sp. SIO1I7]